ncbi:MAG: translational GTPase TypA [Chlorobiota bacterium]
MIKDNFRNIAIIAHVDHGKTTLVDAMLKFSGTYRDNQHVEERVMDSMDQEKERGITISAKNTAVYYEDKKINIMDTPGHADFGGEVERSLSIVDGAILLVDSSEGPLPQTRFVVKKALKRGLPIILVINKIDRPDGRIKEVIDEVYDLFIDVDATDEQIDFPILYTIGKDGIAKHNLEDDSQDLKPLFDTIIEKIPGPTADDSKETQFLAASLDYDNYVGQIAIGRVWNGLMELNKQYAVSTEEGLKHNMKLSSLYSFSGLSKAQVDKVEAGDIVAIAGIEDIKIGDTITDNENPKPLDRIEIDDPTVSMVFYVNNSPFAGTEGKFVTSRHIKARLDKETKLNVSLKVKETERTDAFEVSGRGELQLGVLIETMRREGYELMVSKPNVITKTIDGKKHEPYEQVFVDVPDEHVGIVTEKLQSRKGQLVNMMAHGHGRTDIEFLVPSRGLIGYRSQFLTDTKGAGIINNLFDSYREWAGDISQRSTGVLVADRNGKTTEYACLGMEDRGILIVGIGVKVYMGMVVGERNKPGDLNINIVREKQLTNMRASGSDNTVTLRPHKQLTLDASIEFLSEDELLEVTPESIRIRKAELDPNKRKRSQKG